LEEERDILRKVQDYRKEKFYFASIFILFVLKDASGISQLLLESKPKFKLMTNIRTAKIGFAYYFMYFSF
jgi:hypothetical protein